MGESNTLNNSIEKALKNTLETIKAEYDKQCIEPAEEQDSGTVGQNPQTDTQHAENQSEESKTITKRKTTPNAHRRRI